MPVPRRMPCALNPPSHRLPRNQSWKIRRTLAGERERATSVPETRVPGKLLQNHLELGTAPVDHRQLPPLTCLRLLHPARLPPRNPGASQPINLHSKAAFPVAKEKNRRNRKPCYLFEDI
jgi:hypothetical protein